MKVRNIFAAVKVIAGLTLLPAPAGAHVSEQGFVLLLPTGAYTAAGVAVVALTVLMLAFLPAGAVRALFRAKPIAGLRAERLQIVTSLAATAALFFLIWLGLNGPRDPLSNLMPLMFWTVGWIGIVSLTGLFGDLWQWLNPWTGLYRIMGPLNPLVRLPDCGVWPAFGVLLIFAAFLLADLAPDDPARLAWLCAGYWAIMMAGLILFGQRWLDAAELGRVVVRAYGALAPAALWGTGGFGVPGWQMLTQPAALSAGIFALTLLAVGSFDGVNETFWWLAQIGINPLAFPGRSAVVVPTLVGLFGSVAALIAIFALTVWVGTLLAGARGQTLSAFTRLAAAVLPIALGYHVAHFLTAFLVNIQYTVAALADPMATGADWLGLQPFYVTTGFFNHIDTVRVIWLTQAGAVVLGHVWSVLLAHRIALDLFPEGRRAALATAPLSIMMIAYTLLGLWLLATPRGA